MRTRPRISDRGAHAVDGVTVLMDKGVELASERNASIRDVIGLALSGGGFRATAFHLGVLKRLRELGLLDRITYLSGVSGGSIAAAHWAYSAAFIGDNCSEDEPGNASSDPLSG
jgi:predicted acylesterase/phospholipase RssA